MDQLLDRLARIDDRLALSPAPTLQVRDLPMEARRRLRRTRAAWLTLGVAVFAVGLGLAWVLDQAAGWSTVAVWQVAGLYPLVLIPTSGIHRAQRRMLADYETRRRASRDAVAHGAPRRRSAA